MSIFSDTFVCQENPLNMLFIHVDVYSSHVANHFVSVMLFTAPPASIPCRHTSACSCHLRQFLFSDEKPVTVFLLTRHWKKINEKKTEREKQPEQRSVVSSCSLSSVTVYPWGQSVWRPKTTFVFSLSTGHRGLHYTLCCDTSLHFILLLAVIWIIHKLKLVTHSIWSFYISLQAFWRRPWRKVWLF